MQPFGCKGTTKSMFWQSPFYGMLHTMFMAFSCPVYLNYKIGCKVTTFPSNFRNFTAKLQVIIHKVNYLKEVSIQC